MSVLNLAAFDGAPLNREPFDFLVVKDAIEPDTVEALKRDFPQVDKPTNYDPIDLDYGPSFKQLLKELDSPEFERYIAESLLSTSPAQRKPLPSASTQSPVMGISIPITGARALPCWCISICSGFRTVVVFEYCGHAETSRITVPSLFRWAVPYWRSVAVTDAGMATKVSTLSGA